MRRLLLSVPLAAVIALAAVSPASAVVPCAITPKASDLVTGQGALESIAFDERGRLLYTDRGRNALMLITKPGAAPKVLAVGIVDPGGIALDGKGHAWVGFGNNIANATAPANAAAGLVKVNLKTGRTAVAVRGLAMANGVVRTTSGEFFASDDLAPSLDRVSAKGKVLRAWSSVAPTNGLALSADGRHLYANESLTPTRVVKIDVRNPRKVTPVATPPEADAGAFLDGLTLGAKDRPYAAAWVAGEVWSGDGKGGFCKLASGLTRPSALAFGRKGSGFDTRSLYVTTYGGALVRLAKAR